MLFTTQSLVGESGDAEVCVRTPTPSYDHEDTDHPTAHSASGGGAMHPVADEEVASLDQLQRLLRQHKCRQCHLRQAFLLPQSLQL